MARPHRAERTVLLAFEGRTDLLDMSEAIAHFNTLGTVGGHKIDDLAEVAYIVLDTAASRYALTARREWKVVRDSTMPPKKGRWKGRLTGGIG